ncbi:hypothetical protein LOZ53_003103 [Ophidiomyces ophidiicola]|nr:hypothetical protein LOZ53_003103 [Ophidiomyces ophidiicola]
MSTFQLMIQAKLQQLREEGNAKNKSAAPDIPSTAKRPRSAEPPDIPHVPAKQAKEIEPAQAPIEQAEPVGLGRCVRLSVLGRCFCDPQLRAKNGEASQSTTFLLQSAKNKTPLRVLRSSRLPNINKYRPVEGLRYDGLYKIESEELMDEPNMLYQFKLKRLPGQTPIRYAGPSKKPNQKEVDEYRTMQKFTSVSRKKAT